MVKKSVRFEKMAKYCFGHNFLGLCFNHEILPQYVKLGKDYPKNLKNLNWATILTHMKKGTKLRYPKETKLWLTFETFFKLTLYFDPCKLQCCSNN